MPDWRSGNTAACGFGEACFQNRCVLRLQKHQLRATLMRSADAVCQTARPLNPGTNCRG
jgi:hypothetical protein